MSAEQNEALVCRFFEMHEDVTRGKADLDALDKLLAPDFVAHSRLLPGQQPGREGYKQAVAELTAAFSNQRFHIEDQAAQGDKVWTRFTVRQTHDRRELLGAAPTGREVSYQAIEIHRISEGKIVEQWALGTASPKLMRQHLERELEQERIERERIEQELEVAARRIQRASLPEEVPKLEGCEITPYYQPAKEVGGDYFGEPHLCALR
jgi:serine phosphatase RsbU (regulator of sigma subunit)